MRVICLGLLVTAFVSLGAAPTPFAKQEPLALRAATPNAASVPRCGKFELMLDLAVTFNNPFDPSQVDVWASFTAPQGRPVRVDGFLDQPHTRKLDNRRERIESAGVPVWKVRFALEVEGRWRYRVFAQDRSGMVFSPAQPAPMSEWQMHLACRPIPLTVWPCEQSARKKTGGRRPK